MFGKINWKAPPVPEELGRSQSHGASRIFVETDSYCNTSLRLYELVDFQVVRDVQVYRKDNNTGLAREPASH